MTMSLKNAVLLGFILLISGSCKTRRSVPDVSATELNISIYRFEQDLFSADPATVEDSIPVWKHKYGKFFRDYCYVTRLGNTEDPLFAERLRMFMSDQFNYTIYKRTLEIFPDIRIIEDEFAGAFKTYRAYFPDKPVPVIYTFVSGAIQSAITDDSILGIGLDKYLGNNEPLYARAGIYKYLTKKMIPEKVVPDGIRVWGETEFAYNDSSDNLISGMIYQGRLLYFTKALLPGKPDSLNLGFTAGELAYLGSNEKSMWTFLIENKLLFSTDRFTNEKYLQEGPFTTAFGRESPARAVVWIGYRIVDSFMRRNPAVTMKELMNETDYLKIMNQGVYNP